MKRIIPLLTLLALCSCGSKDEQSGSSSSKGTSPPPIERVTKPRPKEIVAMERRAMGRWRSPPGMLAGSKNQWLILDIAGTKDVRMEIRSSDLGRDAVTAFATGRVAMSSSGFVMSLPDAKGTLLDFRSASAAFTTTSSILLKTGNGREFQLTYDGQ